jgi:hypothetical protein
VAALNPSMDGIRERLASSLERRDETPNVELAVEISDSESSDAVAVLAGILDSGSAAARNDAVKVLYEIGERKPHLLVPHAPLFLEQMNSRSNRIVWGSLTALACIADAAPGIVFDNLDAVLAAADRGSVIAKDQAMKILITLKSDPAYAKSVTPLLLERLEEAAVNQLPMYAERILPVLDKGDYASFRDVLVRRMEDQMVLSKRKRVEKVIARLSR